VGGGIFGGDRAAEGVADQYNLLGDPQGVQEGFEVSKDPGPMPVPAGTVRQAVARRSVITRLFRELASWCCHCLELPPNPCKNTSVRCAASGETSMTDSLTGGWFETRTSRL
jgi:hypothetical protein